jgi:hypothetical protein
MQATASLVDEFVEWNRMLTLENDRVQAAIVAEHKVFSAEWEVIQASYMAALAFTLALVPEIHRRVDKTMPQSQTHGRMGPTARQS